MWDCGHCGCKSVAADVESCPACFKEREMPKATVGGGASIGAPEPVTAGEPAGVLAEVNAGDAPAPPGRKASKQEWAAHAVALGADPDEVAAMTKADLIAAHGPRAEAGGGE